MSNLDRRQFIGMGAATLGALALWPRSARPSSVLQDANWEMTPAAEKAIEKGLDWLRKIRHPKGYWGCEKGAESSAAITGLAGLAFLATGSTPAAGLYTKEVTECVNWALDVQNPTTGLISRGFDATGIGTFFEHASITMFLTEAYGMSRQNPENDRIQKGVQSAIHYLDKQQNGDGGWGNQGAGSDLAITAAVYSSLRSAHNSGLDVNDASVAKLVRYTEKCALSGGGFRGNHGMFYPTSAGLRVMFSQGRGGDAQVMKSADKVIKHTIASEYGGSISEWDFLAALYATHAFIIENGDFWKQWFPKVREYLIKIQNPDGSWTVEYCMRCRAFATALSLLVLQAPIRSLPMWQL